MKQDHLYSSEHLVPAKAQPDRWTDSLTEACQSYPYTMQQRPEWTKSLKYICMYQVGVVATCDTF